MWIAVQRTLNISFLVFASPVEDIDRKADSLVQGLSLVLPALTPLVKTTVVVITNDARH